MDGFRLGTDRQNDYATKLLRAAPYENLLDASADILDREPETLLATPPSVEEATRIITALERQQPGLEKDASASADHAHEHAGTSTPATLPPPAPQRPAPTHPATAPRFLTARHLRLIALGKRPAPDVVDDDAKWVLEHLRRSLTVHALYVPAPIEPINGSAPITIDHLLAVFNDHDQIAQAFNVSLGTVKGWGATLPQRYAERAEILSGGRIRAPR